MTQPERRRSPARPGKVINRPNINLDQEPMNRRHFFTGSAAVAGGALLARCLPNALAAEPGKKAGSTGVTAPFVPEGIGYKPVTSPNGLTLPWKMVNGVKVYHLVAEPVTHEFAP